LNPTIVVQWSSVDKDGSPADYDWSFADGQIAPWVAAGHKANLTIWANSDGSGAGSCGPEGLYGTPNIGNCAIPTYVWTALTPSNYVTCTPANANGPQLIPNYMDSNGVFMTNYKAFIQGVISHYGSNSNIGYIRIGLGRGGETIPVADWADNTICGQTFAAWGYSVSSWDSNYIEPMLNYEHSLSSKQLMVGITPMGAGSGNQNADFAANTAVPLGIGVGSQGLQKSDLAGGGSCGADWCNLFSQYTGRVPLQLQTVGQSCPDNASCPTGSLVTLLPFAVANHATIIELYYQDWLAAFDLNFSGYAPAYATVIEKAAAGK
jgi:hypothetical protein